MTAAAGEQDTWEHRITVLEEAVRNGLEAVEREMRALRVDLVARVDRSEERLFALELWRAMRTEEIAFETGQREGRQGLRKSEMGVMAAVFTAGGVIVGLIPHIWSLIR